MKTLWMSGAAAVMAISIAGVQAQSTQQPPAQTPPAASATGTQATTTVRGCVYEEKSIPGRSPNVAERAGVLEDYILVASNAAAPGTAGTSGAAGTSGSMAGMHKAFKLEHAADEQLKAMVGKMVEVTGKIDAEKGDSARATGAASTGAAGAARSTGVGPDKLELPEFEVTSIKEIPGTCPATPDIKK